MKTIITLACLSSLFLLGSCGWTSKKEVIQGQDAKQTYRAIQSNNTANTVVPQQATTSWQSTEQVMELSSGFPAN